MKCINKMAGITLSLVAALSLTGCGAAEVTLDNAYDVYQTTDKYIVTGEESNSGNTSFFATDLCVTSAENISDDAITSDLAQNIGVFSLKDNTVDYAQNIYDKIYPASTTKILTSYIALKYGKLDDVVTVSANAVNLASDASVCGLAAGDQLTLEQLLYGLMLKSGNDAAIAIAEYISGDVDTFATLMNQEAVALGATGTHFVNPNGLHDEDHYTTAYDLYLMFNAAVANEEFTKIIGTATYNTSFTDATGAAKNVDWSTTNKFLLGTVAVPDGVTVVGGKTGTTDAAGHCDVLYSQDGDGNYTISVVLNSESTDNMYSLLSELLTQYSK